MIANSSKPARIHTGAMLSPGVHGLLSHSGPDSGQGMQSEGVQPSLPRGSSVVLVAVTVTSSISFQLVSICRKKNLLPGYFEVPYLCVSL